VPTRPDPFRPDSSESHPGLSITINRSERQMRGRLALPFLAARARPRCLRALSHCPLAAPRQPAPASPRAWDEVPETLHPGDDVVLVSAFLFGAQRFRHMQARWKSQRRVADTCQDLFAGRRDWRSRVGKKAHSRIAISQAAWSRTFAASSVVSP
jgi:hypothetical protein